MAPAVTAALAIAIGPARAQSAGGGHGGAHPTVTGKPLIDLSQPAESTDFTQALTHDLNAIYDDYLAFKNDLQNAANIQFSMPVSIYGQWGTPKGGPGDALLVYSPSVTWTPFSNAAIGSGVFNFSMQSNQFWTRANTGSRQASMGMITPPNDWSANSYQYAQITYTYNFPGNWLAVAVGQYSFAQYDSNEYAGDAQTNFINYALAQNATQTYANAGTGAYVQVTPNSHLQFAGGAQNATDITGQALTANGWHDGQIASFLTAQWTPAFLAGGSYGVIVYHQPSVPLQPGASQGVSFSAAQNLTAKYGVFVRVNNASGEAIPIETSVAFGGVANDPFGRDRLDQAGIGLAWNKANQAALGSPPRRSEFVAELYYNFRVFKGWHITPDVQVYANPVLAPDHGQLLTTHSGQVRMHDADEFLGG
jgi:hypothetical protein